MLTILFPNLRRKHSNLPNRPMTVQTVSNFIQIDKRLMTTHNKMRHRALNADFLSSNMPFRDYEVFLCQWMSLCQRYRQEAEAEAIASLLLSVPSKQMDPWADKNVAQCRFVILRHFAAKSKALREVSCVILKAGHFEAGPHLHIWAFLVGDENAQWLMTAVPNS